MIRILCNLYICIGIRKCELHLQDDLSLICIEFVQLCVGDDENDDDNHINASYQRNIWLCMRWFFALFSDGERRRKGEWEREGERLSFGFKGNVLQQLHTLHTVCSAYTHADTNTFSHACKLLSCNRLNDEGLHAGCARVILDLLVVCFFSGYSKSHHTRVLFNLA